MRELHPRKGNAAAASRGSKGPYGAKGPYGDRGRPSAGNNTSNGHGSIRLEKKLGQHLLKNPGVLDKIISASNITSSDTVLEIGPGTGNLTMRLLPIARKVVALDIDERMVGEVRKRAMSLGYTNLEAKFGNALRSEFGKFDVCTANLPSDVPKRVRRKVGNASSWSSLLKFDPQRNFVVDELCAQPNDKMYCRLGINTQIFCRVERIGIVKAGSFIPPPKVDSMLVKLTPRRPPLQIDFREWDGLLRVCFMRKNKTLHGNFTTKSVLAMLEFNCKEAGVECVNIKELVQTVLNDTGLSARRAISIEIEEFLKLLLAFNTKGIHFRSRGAKNTSGMNGDEDVFSGMPDDFYMSVDDEETATNESFSPEEQET